MTKDYAKPSTTRGKSNPGNKAKSKKAASRPSAKGASRAAPPPPPKKGKLILILVLLLGIFLGGIYLLQTLPETNKAQPAQPKSHVKQSKPATEAPTPSTEQRFKFYDLLPESEVIPPKVDTYHFKEKTQSNDFFYMVQTGSFRSLEDAERQKATIAFQGLKADIKAVTGSNGTTWYRVMTGPYYSRSKMNSALDKLVNIGIEPLVKKLKKQ